MIRTLLSAVLVSLSLSGRARSQCTFSESSVPQRPALVYRFALRTVADTTLLAVTFDFRGSPTGIDTLAVPTQWAGQRLSSMRNLRALGTGVEIDTIPGRDARLVRHAPDAPVRIAYDLEKDWSGSLNHPYEFHPMISPEYVEFTGNNALVHPRFTDPYTPIIAHFDWSGLPASWGLATSFGAAEGTSDDGADDKRNDRCQTSLGTWFEVNGALYAAGDFRFHRFAIRGKPAVLAIRGAWLFSDSAVVAEIQRDVGLVREFWRDDEFPYFLVTWAPFDKDHGSSDGTAFTNALWIFMSRLDSLSTQITQLTHESFHAWNPRKMGRAVNGEERLTGWFHEGFTTYYADDIAYRAGLIPLSRVVQRANRDIESFTGSTDPYVRGDVIARWLDGAIRAGTQGRNSLDDVMRDLVRGAAQPLTLARIFETADRYLSSDDRSRLRALIDGSADLRAANFEAGELSPCVRVTMDSSRAGGVERVIPQLHIVDGYAPRPGVCGFSMK